jgi:hypothetical protein
MIPVEVIQSPACVSLPHYAFRLLILFAAQFTGRNNGDLEMTWERALRGGMTGKRQLCQGLVMLALRGLILKTRQGGIAAGRGMGRKPTLYAVTWRKIDPCEGKLEVPATEHSSEAWRDWQPPAKGLPGGHVKPNTQRTLGRACNHV